MSEQQHTLTVEQCQAAAAAGARILADDSLKVPMDIARTGHLGILQMLLTGVANGMLIFTSPPKAGDVSPDPDRKPALRAVDGGDSA